MNQKLKKTILFYIISALPLLLIIIALIISFFVMDEITVKDILRYTPDNHLLAAVFIICLYMLKSILIVFPIIVLYISTGFIFHPFWAILINLLGATACISIPYWLGYFFGHKLTALISKKYVITQRFDEFKQDNEWFFVFIVRIIGILPCDIASMLMGTVKISFPKYILASLAGMLPNLIFATILGISITNPRSPEFILSGCFIILLSVLSILIHKKVKYKKPS